MRPNPSYPQRKILLFVSLCSPKQQFVRSCVFCLLCAYEIAKGQIGKYLSIFMAFAGISFFAPLACLIIKLGFSL